MAHFRSKFIVLRQLTPAQINRVLKTCLLMQHGDGKRCAVALSHAAMRVTEIALLRTEHVLLANGKIRDEIHLPASICKMLKPRTKANRRNVWS